VSKVVVTKEELKLQILTSVNLSKLIAMVDEISDLVVSKNHDYGDAWQKYGIFTPLIRINDKILRVETLSTGEHALVADEKIEDTLRDIIGYAALALMKLESNKPKSEDEIDRQLLLWDLHDSF
jgi:Na+-translocating ferredoxin:NAD+ oxidoreductase RnfA subunit